MELGSPMGLEEGEIRSGFIRKVYGILTAQLFVTALIAFPIQRMDAQWVLANRLYAQIAMGLSLVFVVAISCCTKVARTVPYNYMFLFGFTVCESVIVGFISAMYTTESVVMAAMMTAGIFFGLTAYAVTTKTDFTGMGGYLMAVLLGMCVTSVVLMFFHSAFMQTLQAGVGAILFSIYIVYDTQLICGGKHKQSFGVDDYVFAALNIYLDIINLFLYLLQLFGDRK